MSVYKPKNSKYYHFDFQVHSERFSGSTGLTSKRDAQRYEAERRREVVLGTERKQRVTVDEAFGTWFHSVGAHTSTAKTVEGQARKLISAFGAARPFEDLSIRDLDNFVAELRAAGRSNATANRYCQLLRRVANFMASRDFEVPEIAWKDVMLTEPPERIRELSSEEEAKLFNALPEDLLQVVRFSLMCGQRRTAVIRLRWSDIDLGHGRATFLKKGGGSHDIPLSLEMVEFLKRQPKAGPFVFTYVCERTSPARKDRPPRVRGMRYPFSKQGWTRKWKRALATAGIADFRWHDLRHDFATKITRSTGNLKITQRLLGHSDIATTARYAHVIDDDLRNALSTHNSRNIPEESQDRLPNVLKENAHKSSA